MSPISQELGAEGRSRFSRAYRKELRQAYGVALPVMGILGGLLTYAGVPVSALLATYGMLLAGIPLLAFPAAFANAEAHLSDDDLRHIARRRLNT